MQTELSPRRGILLALASAATFGGITPLASITYDDGATALAVLLLRSAFGIFVFAVAAVLLGLRLRITWNAWLALLPVAFSWRIGSFGDLGAVHYLPVGLAAIVFFTFPVIVAIASWAIERRQPRMVPSMCCSTAPASCITARCSNARKRNGTSPSR